MLRRSNPLRGDKRGASDGEIGHVKDFYFDDQHWAVLFLPSTEASLVEGAHNGDDPHLRSIQALNGYHIQTSDGAIGHVTDFVIDDKSWAICHVVVETGHWFSGKEIVISPNQISRISYDESSVFVNVTKEAILEAPEYHATPLGENTV